MGKKDKSKKMKNQKVSKVKKRFKKKKEKLNSKRKIKNQLIIATLLLGIIPMLAVGILNYYFEKGNMEEMLEESNLTIAKSMAGEIDVFINSSFNVLDTLSGTHNFLDMDDFESRKVLRTTIDKVKHIQQIYVFDKYGNEITASQSMGSNDIDSKKWFNNALEGKKHISDSYLDKKSNLPGIIISTPVKNFMGEIEGVIAAKIGLNELVTLANEQNIGKTGLAYIIDKTGVIIGHKEVKKMVLDRYNINEKNIKGAKLALQGKTDYSTYKNIDGNLVIGAYTKVPSTGWGVVIEQDKSEVTSMASEGLIRNLGIISIAIILILIFTSIIARRFSKPLVNLALVVNKIKDGDLTKRSKVDTKNEIGELQKSFNKMAESLYGVISSAKGVVTNVEESSKELSNNVDLTLNASQEISSVVEQVASGTENQMESVETTTNVIHNMSDQVKDVEKRSSNILQAANQASNIAKDGSKDIEETKTVMNNIVSKVKESSDQISELTKYTDDIGKMITFIDGISEQTNLLALNAAIEAARAGEYGKGFAVVAEEIRKLAEQSGNASKEIVNIIEKIQKETKLVSKSMDDGIKEVNKGTKVIDETTKSFENIHKETDGVSKIIEEFSSIVKELSKGMDDIEKSITKVSSISQETGAGTQQVLASTEEQVSAIHDINKSAEELNAMAEELRDLVKEFKLD
ncbi:MAG: methyl-accepting chemotaxis protein [Firmicutes bacterium]|nr:methyl-accepting chemotaxis protein [Bacillota bacterium]